MALHRIDRMAVEDEGDGDAVVCVHGLGGSSNTFTPLMPALARHRVLRVDLPGSARSQHCEGAIVHGACVQLGVTRAHLVGHSLGTIVCQHLAVKAPSLVRSLALFGPLMAPTDAARAALRARAAKARSEGDVGMQDITASLLQGALSADTRQRQPLAVAYVRESLLRQQPGPYASTCEALADAQPARVDQIACPVLLVTGDEDAVAPPQAVRAMAERLHLASRTRVEVLSRCGHWTPIERVAECQTLLREFLAAQRQETERHG